MLGANGSGKSTLLRLLDGLCFAASGTVRFCGEPLTEERFQDETFSFDFRRRVGLVFQNPDVQLFNPTVFDELAFGPLQLRWPPDLIRQRVAQTLDDLNIAHLKDRPPHRLSGGEKKRVAIASVLILDPQVLLLDEPTAALDPRSQSQTIDLLAGWKDTGRTVVTATHDLDSVEEIADYCFVFQAGRLVAQGAPGGRARRRRSTAAGRACFTPTGTLTPTEKSTPTRTATTIARPDTRSFRAATVGERLPAHFRAALIFPPISADK